LFLAAGYSVGEAQMVMGERIARMMGEELTMQADCVGIVLGPQEKIRVCVTHPFSRIRAVFAEGVSQRCSRQQEQRSYEKAEGLNCYPKPG
jgi:hypothetical protein